MSTPTSTNKDDTDATDVPLESDNNKEGDIYQTIADSSNVNHQGIIDDSILTAKEEAALEDIEVSDIFSDAINGLEMNLARDGKSVIFSIENDSIKTTALDESTFSYVVEMSSRAMKDAQEKIKKEIDANIPFDRKYSTLSVPHLLKGFDNKKTMKSFINYLKKASAELIKAGDLLQSNIRILEKAEVQSVTNEDWLFSRRYEWDDRNVSEIASMKLIGSDCRSTITRMELELRDIRNQISAIRIRSSAAGDELTEMVEEYLKDGFEVVKATNAIKNNNLVAKLNKSHNNAITKLINDQKESDKQAFDEFTKKINDLNDSHALKMSDLRTKHAEDMEAQRLEFKKNLEAQALKFSKILDETNALHKKEVAELHVFYKDKLAEVVAGYEKTIADLKIIIDNYSTKLDEANRLISSYYTALDDSQKNQANLLSEYKELAANRLQKIDSNITSQKVKSLDVSDAPVATETSLQGSLALNASLGKQTEEAEAIALAKTNDAQSKKDLENKVLIFAGIGLTAIGGLIIYLKGEKTSEKSSAKEEDKSENKGDENVIL